jgi:hypothetical protein
MSFLDGEILLHSPCTHGEAKAAQGEAKGVGESSLGDHVAEIDAEVNDGGGDLGANAADDAIGAHETGGGDGLQ